MLETRGDLPVDSSYKGIIDVGQEDTYMLIRTRALLLRGIYSIPKSAVAIASFPRPRDFGSSWVSWLSGARMGLVSSTDMAPQYQCRIADGKSEEFKSDILREYYIRSKQNPSPRSHHFFSFVILYAFTLRTFSAQLPGWTDTPCLVQITTTNYHHRATAE